MFSRIFRKPPPATTAPAGTQPAVPAQSQPPPDPAAVAREEDASLSQAITAGDMATVGKWVVDGSSTRVRQRAAEAISDLDQLHELIRATRHGNDKKVYRILTTKRDELLAEERRGQQLQADVEAAAAAIGRHCERPVDAQYATTLGQLEARWQALAEHATPDLQYEVAQRLKQAREEIERHRQALEAEAERQRSAALAAEEARRQREVEAEAAAAVAA